MSNFNQLMAQGASAIVLYPLAPNSLRVSLAKAKKQGVVVTRAARLLPPPTTS